MPIYEYRCSACGHKLEILQKMSDKAPTDCPACGKATLSKLVSAAGFQLKGSGWYVTDFRDSKKPAGDSGSKSEEKSGGNSEGKQGGSSDSASTGSQDKAPKAGGKSDKAGE